MKNDVEQYKMMIQLYDSEVTRFYTRQSLYIGFQIGIFIGLFAGIKELSTTPILLRLICLALLFFSMITFLISWRL